MVGSTVYVKENDGIPEAYVTPEFLKLWVCVGMCGLYYILLALPLQKEVCVSRG